MNFFRRQRMLYPKKDPTLAGRDFSLPETRVAYWDPDIFSPLFTFSIFAIQSILLLLHHTIPIMSFPPDRCSGPVV